MKSSKPADRTQRQQEAAGSRRHHDKDVNHFLVPLVVSYNQLQIKMEWLMARVGTELD